ncbi:hypothetical protein JQX09_15295 [Sulfitobacter pseudonitzschiae]|uniref:Calcium-binding protein n=1 Tax=Pseudosulfitobacter pseudonitzschiae TaxID=1402135 RepID=A0A9Q2NS59_9RHOB|nr:calcium-binding protein [Pseudosulfitobacter pseudonitzschiae]MBM2292696.1 hypothetical protein [Pseudosulfitobacter pseudonitzschiae]MBM2298208.1 hypothetical protein [Pseudosulfitobacter pseudonitzschiae]MBM2303122.1 hypothetical protein [Pseudosulfitobacter pseudonitzschiae]MBM2312905.1 hypothetical protein [Pseudosulfitobacter pseudonitzschiae]MBM2317818.1 hypothetical protein [Pseudosulfitobacter pseudonitzschiae]
MSWTRSLSEFTINTVTSGIQTRGEVAALSDGGFVVSWASDHDGGYDIYACRYDATGAKVGTDFRVNTDLSGRDLRPDVWAYDGGYTVVWNRLDAGDFDVLGRSFDDVSGPTDVFALHDTDAGWQINVRLAGQVASYTSGTSVFLTVLSTGAAAAPLLISAEAEANSETRVLQLAGEGTRFVIGFRNADGHAVAHIYDADTGIVSAQILLSTTAYAPDLHALDSGGFVMLASNGDVQVTVFDATGTALSVIDVTSDPTRYEVQGDALALSAGGFVVFWTVYSGTAQVFAQRYTDTGLAVGTQLALTLEDADGSAQPQLAELADGRLLVTYTALRDGADDVMAQILTVDAVPVDGTAGDDHLFLGALNDTLMGHDGDDTLDGLDGDDDLSGLRGNDTLDGGAGHDTLSGGSNRDRLNGGRGRDLLDGGRSRDVLDGGRGDDTLYGGDSRDALYGNLGDDVLFGDAGADRLSGDEGADTLTGGAGADLFVFNAGDGADIITDFEDGVDRIRIATGAASMDDLTITDLGADTRVTFADVTFVLLGVDHTLLDSTDFVF